MKLDATDLRYITTDEFRVLTAVRSTVTMSWTNAHCVLGRNGLQKPRGRADCLDFQNRRTAQWRC